MLPDLYAAEYHELHRLLGLMIALSHAHARGEVDDDDYGQRALALRDPIVELTSKLQAALVIDIARNPE
jgi:hypothetical protein